MAKFIIIRGQRNSGKTTTCGIVYTELLRIAEVRHIFNDKDVETNSLEYNKENGSLKDFKAILTIKGKMVGIISAGDVADLLEKDINDLIDKKIEIIICCTRSKDVPGSSQRRINEKFTPNNQILIEVWSQKSQIEDDKEIIKMQSVFEIIKTVNINL